LSYKFDNILITGCLGSLGYALTETLLKLEYSVVGIDNLDPAASIPPCFKHKLDQLKELENFKFFADDIRSFEIDQIVDNISENKSILIFHCAAALPTRRGFCDEDLIHEISYEAPLSIIKQFEKVDLDSHSILFHHLVHENQNIDNLEPLWKSILKSEHELRSEISTSDSVTFLEIPTLWGPGQSIRTAPLRQIWQHLSQRSIETSNNSLFRAIWLPDLVKTVVENINNLSILKSSIESSLAIKQIDLNQIISRFPFITEVENGETVFDNNCILPDISESETIDEEEVDELIKTLIEWTLLLPYAPPVDWPQRPKIEARLRRSRRHRKAKREGREKN
jgi:NAD dependent epimerase/dehydratase family